MELNIGMPWEIPIELIDRQDIPSLLAKLSEYIGCGAAYRDIIKIRTYASSVDYNFLESVKTYPVWELQRKFCCFWLVESGVRCGCLIIEKKERDPAVINAALIGIRILIRRELQEQLRRKKYASDLFLEILKGGISDETTLMERLRSIGIRKNYPCLLLTLDAGLSSEESRRGEEDILWDADNIEKRLAAFFAHAFLIKKNGTLRCVFLLDGSKQKDTLRLKESIETAARAFINLIGASDKNCRGHVGVSSVKPSMLLLPECAREASRALVYAKIHGLPEKLVYWDEIGSFRILFEISGGKEAKEMHSRMLNKLIGHDQTHKSNLMETLLELVRNNWNISRTAEKLLFHQNTVKYRYRKICELLDGNINNGAFRFDLDFALKLQLIYTYSIDEGGDD